MITYYRYKNENLGMEFSKIPPTYRTAIRKQYLDEVESGLMTVARYEELTGEVYPVEEEQPTA